MDDNANKWGGIICECFCCPKKKSIFHPTRQQVLGKQAYWIKLNAKQSEKKKKKRSEEVFDFLKWLNFICCWHV